MKQEGINLKAKSQVNLKERRSSNNLNLLKNKTRSFVGSNLKTREHNLRQSFSFNYFEIVFYVFFSSFFLLFYFLSICYHRNS